MRVNWYQKSLMAILGVAVAGSTVALVRGDYEFFDPLITIKAIVSQKYVEQPDEAEMQLGAIRGMLEALNDPYTEYVPPAQTREFTKDLTGDYVGIGVSVVPRDGWLTVVTPLEDGPAYRLGILADDRIVEIDGKSTSGLSGDECVELLTGEAGTKVSIVIERDGQRMPFEITRERIVARTVKGFHWTGGGNGGTGGGAPADNGAAPAAPPAEARWQHIVDQARKIAYLRLTQFTPTSAQEMKQTLLDMGADRGGVGGLVLDLRGNPGGSLSDAIEIADLFISSGTIVSTRGRSSPPEVASAEAEGTLPDFPMVVLVNGQSASASEVLAGALVENRRAIVLGTRTFGKGLVQGVMNVPGTNGGQLKLTEARYYLPNGRSIHRTDDATAWGVDPSDGFYVPLTDEETAELLRVRRDEEVIAREPHAGREQNWSDPAWILEHLKDKQLAAAMRAVQGRIDTGEWTPTGGPNPDGADIAAGELTRAVELRERWLRELTRLDRRIEALESAADPDAAAGAADFWDDELDLTGGTLRITDKDGNEVTTLRITGNNLERWLLDADVRKPGEGEK